MGSKLARWVAMLGAFAAVTAFAVPRGGGGGPQELLYLGTESGVTALDPGTGDAVFSAREALPSGDWSLLVNAQRDAAGTSVQALDPVTGGVLATSRVDGSLRVRTVSFAGDQIALMPRAYGGGLGMAEGRASTRIVLTGFDGTPPRTLDVEANVEPEAFSTDGRTLFVIQYKPALHPDRYQVRQLDLTTGLLGDIFTNDKDIQGDMEGIARTQALSPDGRRLYTLYTKDGHEAFVHDLNLEEKVANCIDLPKPFGEDPESMALTTSPPSGLRLYVADTAHDRVAEIDTASLRVVRTERVDKLPGGTNGSPAISASATKLFVARGTRVTGLMRGSLEVVSTWRFDGTVRSIQGAGEQRQELYVAEPRRVTAINTRTGVRMSRFATPPGVEISHVGYSLPQTSIGSYQCAC